MSDVGDFFGGGKVFVGLVADEVGFDFRKGFGDVEVVPGFEAPGVGI